MLALCLHKILRKAGFEIQRTPSALNFLTSRGVDLVLDVGANRGQYARGLRSLGYKGAIHSFEPIKAEFDMLAARAAGDSLWQLSHCAVGATAGTATLNVSENSVFSSIHSLSPLGVSFSRKAAVVRQETVPMVTLDSHVQTDAQAIFLKIDTQGYERAVLAGAPILLNRCVGLQLELPVEHLYEGVWSFNEAMEFVDSLGFTPAQFRTVNALKDDRASAVEFDCIFRRKRTPRS